MMTRSWSGNERRLLRGMVGPLVLVWMVQACLGGTISGTVTAKGKAAGGQGSEGKYSSRKFKFVEQTDYKAFRDFVVYIEGPLTNAPASEKRAVVQQKDAAFDPHVLPVMAGTVVEWPNRDDIFHNVFSYSEVKKFDLGLYKDEKGKAVRFDAPGRVDVFCSIHSRMHCVVLVLENPFFAKSDRKGRYKVEGVPAGSYRLNAWHERLPMASAMVEVPEEGEVEVDFELGLEDLPKY